jgi:hypothetical protein
MRGIAVGLSSSAPAPPAPTEGIQRSEPLGCVGRAYRAGRLVCGCVHVTISLDERLGLTEDERRIVRVRFHEPVADDLRDELHQLVRRRGRASDRAAERIDPIELVIDAPHGEHKRITGRLRPPHRRHGRLREVEFGFDQLQPAR